MDGIIRVALYMRVSTDEQAKRGLSLLEQEKTLEEYAKAHNMKIVGRYLDGGKSARKRYTSRPEFMRLLNDVKADMIDTILFIKLDRWFRNVADYYEVQKILEAHHVTWRATQEDYETVTASGRFKVNIMLSVAQDEADRTSERIKFVFEGKRERNEPITGKLPKGYQIEEKEVKFDPDLAPRVRAAFDMYLESGSTSKVIRSFPELHLNYQSARYMFTNPAYAGDFAGISIPPLITQAEHEQAVATNGKTTRKATRNRVYVFSGLLFCSECGRRLGGRTFSNGRQTPVVYYQCRGHQSERGCSSGTCYREDKLEQVLLATIDGRINAEMLGQEKQSATSYKPQRDAVKRKLSRLSELYVADLISLSDYKRQFQELNDELEAIPEDKPKLDIDTLRENFFPGWQDIYTGLSRDGKQAFWRKTISDIHVASGAIADFNFR